MNTLEMILENKFKIFQLVEEWGFAASSSNKLSIYVEKINQSDESRVFLIVDTDPKLIKKSSLFSKNEELRRGYLEDELVIHFNCDLTVSSFKSLKVEGKEKTIKNSKNLMEDNKNIINHFSKNKFIKVIDKSTLKKKFLSDIYALDAVKEFKSQIAKKKYGKSNFFYLNEKYNTISQIYGAYQPILTKIKYFFESDKELFESLRKNPELLTVARMIYLDSEYSTNRSKPQH